LNERIKKLWVEALRSGKYPQTSGCLRDTKGFCCLAVLCDIHSQETGTNWNDGDYLNQSDILPPGVVKWAELDSNNPILCEDMSATDANDEEGLSFSQIADLISANL
jgi:hypothetical protein